MISINDHISYSAEAETIFKIGGSRDMFAVAEKPIEIQGLKVAPWGADNDLPQKVLQAVEVNEIVSSNLLFNIQSAYGLGIQPMMRQEDGSIGECTDVEVNNFFEDNDITGFFLEQVSDMMTFFNVFPQIILSGDRKKIVALHHLEAAFSRWASMTETQSEISQHLYSSKWGSSSKPSLQDIDVSPVLSRYHTLANLQARASKEARFVLQVSMPTPGRTYYANAYWHSIFRSGWYDLSCMIPKNKIAILKNNLTVRTVVYISEKYWDGVMKREGITSQSDPTERERLKNEELTRIRDFISNENGKGGTLITSKETYASSAGKAIEDKQIVIEPIKSELNGGELIQDSEEASNIISYAMGVHSSLNGAALGKNSGALGGSDKATLYDMKQAMMQAFTDRLLKPLTLIKRFNKWPENVVFQVPRFEFSNKITEKDANK